ncbi:metallopeptidase family protein [Patescibacteria group bacterium]|nr:metallopeptidase family protein [Patescibacteria group bacterium]
MEQDEFEAIALSEWQSVPERFAALVQNVALLIEDEPSAALRTEEGLQEGETLLGVYHGVPNTERGSEYGVGGTLPDTITLFRLPILAEAEELTDDHTSQFREYVRQVIRETIWHEVGHYFGLDEHPINERERGGTNRFAS